jgi:hypothetical protein
MWHIIVNAAAATGIGIDVQPTAVSSIVILQLAVKAPVCTLLVVQQVALDSALH